MHNTYIVGLGNPGEQYAKSRHNVGFMIVEALAKKLGAVWAFEKKFNAEVAHDQQHRVFLMKPQTFMNGSGEAVRSILGYYEKALEFSQETTLEKLVVCYDDLDIMLGEYKRQFGKHPKIHNGINSVIDHLHTDQFWNLRIGTEHRPTEERAQGETYVLEPFSTEERGILAPLVQNVVQEVYAAFVSPQPAL